MEKENCFNCIYHDVVTNIKCTSKDFSYMTEAETKEDLEKYNWDKCRFYIAKMK